MKHLRNIPIYVMLIVLLFSCNTAQRAYNSGNYYEATMYAVKKLRNKPDDTKMLALIEKSYPMAVDYSRQNISELLASNNQNKYFRVVEEYQLLNTMADEISRCPAALDALRPVVYFHDQQKKAEQLAFDEQVDYARVLLNTGRVNDARLAIEKLMWVKQKKSNYPNIDNLLAEAQNLATLKVVLEPLPEINRSHRINSIDFYARIYDYLQSKVSSNYLRFYKPDFAQEMELVPDEVVSIQFTDFNIGTMLERENTTTYKNDSMVVGTFTDDKGIERPVKGPVKATVTVYSRELITRGVLVVTIRDHVSGEVIESRKFPNEFRWKNDWANFNGDERAVPPEIFELTKNRQVNPPDPQDMFLVWSDPLFDKAASFLRTEYRRKR